MKIDESIQIGNQTFRTRIVMPPIATYRCTQTGGNVTDEMIDYYGKCAANKNVGLIITEHSYITMQGKAKEKQLSIADDSNIEGLSRLTDVIHQNGDKVFAQLNHAGSAAIPNVTNMDIVAPSSIALPVVPPISGNEMPKELSKTEIENIIEAFVQASIRAKKAGYDGVEIHSAHGYLLNQFYSPLTNRRKDEYGGSLENRLRIHTETIRAVRQAVGNDYSISVRFGGCDYMEGGSTIDDCVKACRLFEKEGVDMISLSGGMCRYTRKGHTEPGYFQDMSLAVKKQVSIPVLLTGGVTTRKEAEQLIENHAADLVGVGRALLKNPQWEDM